MENREQKIAELNEQEAIARQEMEKEYMDFITPYELEFEAATEQQRIKAMKILDPVRERIDKKVSMWRLQLAKKVDKEMLKYNIAQKKAQDQFNATTTAEKAKYEEQIRDRREQFEAEWAAIAAKNDAIIAELSKE